MKPFHKGKNSWDIEKAKLDNIVGNFGPNHCMSSGFYTFPNLKSVWAQCLSFATYKAVLLKKENSELRDCLYLVV